MHEELSLIRAASAIARHAPRIPFLKFGEGVEQLAVAYRKKGATIEDDACDGSFQALQTGLYQRFRKITGSHEGFTWMRVCSIEEDEIRDVFAERFNAMSHVEIESIPLDASFQVMQYEGASERATRRRAGSLRP
jgi:hypothetical protein